MTNPRIIVALEPSTRSYQEWTPPMLRSAEVLADGGYLRMAADLCWDLFADDRIKGVLDARADALFGCPLSFTDGRGRQRRAAAKAIEEGADFENVAPDATLRQIVQWGWMLGAAPYRHAWQRSAGLGSRWLPKLEFRNPRWLRWDWSSRSWKLTVVNDRSVQSEIEIDPGGGEWGLFQPYGADLPWRFGAYRALSRWYLLKFYARNDWGAYSERHGQGILVAEGAGGSDSQRKEIAADLQQLRRNATIALPDGFKLSLIEAQARTWDTFQAQINMADQAYAITINGQNLTTQVSAGTNAAATVHEHVALAKTRADESSVSTCLHDQTLVHWAEVNFSDPNAAGWPTWDVEPAEDTKAIAAVWQQAGQAIQTFDAAGFEVDPDEVKERFGITLKRKAPPEPSPTAPTPSIGPKSEAIEPPMPSTAPSSEGLEDEDDDVSKE